MSSLANIDPYIRKFLLVNAAYFPGGIIPWKEIKEGKGIYYDIREVYVPFNTLSAATLKLMLKSHFEHPLVLWCAIIGRLQLLVGSNVTVSTVGSFDCVETETLQKAMLGGCEHLLTRYVRKELQYNVGEIKPNNEEGDIVQAVFDAKAKGIPVLACEAVVANSQAFLDKFTEKVIDCALVNSACTLEVVKKMMTEVVLVDKSDPLTYTTPAIARSYVASTFLSRVSDIMSILQCVGPGKYVFLHDGAGPGSYAAKVLGYESKSYDVSDAMIEISKNLHTGVEKHSNMRDVVKDNLGRIFFVSHSETVDPGLVHYLLELKQEIVVYEGVAGYKGYSQLHECHPYVRSTFPYVMKVELSRRYKKNYAAQQWFSLVSSEKVTTDTVRGLDAMRVYKGVFNLVPKVFLIDEKLKEIAKAKGYELVEDGEGAVVVYSGHTNLVGRKYFNVAYGTYHGLPKLNSMMVDHRCILVNHRAGAVQICGGYFTILTRGKYTFTFDDMTTYLVDVTKILEFGVIRRRSSVGISFGIGTETAKRGMFIVGIVIKIEDHISGSFPCITDRIYHSVSREIEVVPAYSPFYCAQYHMPELKHVKFKLLDDNIKIVVRGVYYRYSLESNDPIARSEFKMLGCDSDDNLLKQIVDDNSGHSRRFKVDFTLPINNHGMIKLIFKITRGEQVVLCSTGFVSCKTAIVYKPTDMLLHSQELVILNSAQMVKYM